MATTYKQDMPPSGGYRPLDFSRQPARSLMPGKVVILGHFALTGIALYLYKVNADQVHRDNVEARSSMIAIMPLLQAEKDREYLKQLRRNRAEEEQLMKGVPGWEVGTYYGEPIYKTFPEDKLIKPHFSEYFVHGSAKRFKEVADFALWQ